MLVKIVNRLRCFLSSCHHCHHCHHGHHIMPSLFSTLPRRHTWTTFIRTYRSAICPKVISALSTLCPRMSTVCSAEVCQARCLEWKEWSHYWWGHSNESRAPQWPGRIHYGTCIIDNILPFLGWRSTSYFLFLLEHFWFWQLKWIWDVTTIDFT